MHTLFAISSAAVLATNLMAANAQAQTVHPTLQLEPVAQPQTVIDQQGVIAKIGGKAGGGSGSKGSKGKSR